MTDIRFLIIQLVILILSFLAGKYVFPHIKSINFEKLSFISTWAYNFVVEAKNLFITASGAEKKKIVTKKVFMLCERYGIDISADEVSALIEQAYSAMKDGEKNAG